MQYVAFSGGKDSTAMALALRERGEIFEMIYTPTGNELPGMQEHIDRVAGIVERRLHRLRAPTLVELIHRWSALPNWRQRYCTRLIKIEPCKAFLIAHPSSTLCVGFRADEEIRQGLYGGYARYRYPLRELGWKLADVFECLQRHRMTVPRRTDCALCYGQRLSEWWRLWADYRTEFEAGVELERICGHTFRSAQRDSWPASLSDLQAEFEVGRVPRGADQQYLPFEEDLSTYGACRICRM